MNFSNPWLLLLLLLLPVFIAIAWPRRNPLRQTREAASLGLRCLIVLLLVLALAGMAQVQTSQKLSAIFLLDVSDSVGTQAQGLGVNYIRQALAGMGPDDAGGVVLFGAEALVERPVSPQPNFGEPASIPIRNYTNIAGAIRLGLSLFPEAAARRLVILSDGGNNLEDARQAAQLAAGSGVEVSVVPLPRQSGIDARLADLRAPATLHEGEKFDLTVRVHSDEAMVAPLQIFSKGRLVAQQELSLQPGDNTFILPLTAGEPGVATFQARLTPPLDLFPQNNILDAFSQVEGPLSILLVAAQAGEGEPLATALRQAGLTVSQISPAELPSDLGRLNQYAAIVLVNVPATRLAPRQLQLFQSYVRDLGHGLVVVGGETSYGPGGYFQTALEETLPVEMTIQDKERLPGMTLMMVIDKSGSMADGGTPQIAGPRKIELAKEAIYRSLDLLVPWDRVGVVAFDNTAQWVVTPVPAVNIDNIKDQVGTLRASGGTDIFAGLKVAAEAIEKENTQIRHIVLLTDGGADPGGIPELAQSLVDQGVTLSVVAIGQGYAPFLEDVAKIGQGRFHLADDASVIPQIFAQETSLATRSYIVEETIIPEVVNPSPILEGLTSLPPLRGYVATSAKLTAQLVLQGGSEGDPLLAQWQYGLGRAVAWTSDAKGQWALEWLTWPEFPQFWSQAVRWTIIEGSSGGVESQVRLEGNQAVVTTEVLGADGSYWNDLEMSLSLVDPDLKPQTIPMRQIAPGLYEGNFRPNETGIYLFNASGQAGEETVAAQTRGFVMAYSPEYQAPEGDPNLLADLAAIGHGQVLPLDAPAEAFIHSLPPVQGSTPLWPWLLAAAILLLPLDVGLRRVIFNREDLRQLWARLQPWLPHRPQETSPLESSSASSLLKIKHKPGSETPVSDIAKPSVADRGAATPMPEASGISQPRQAPSSVQGRSSETSPQPQQASADTVRRLMKIKQQRRGRDNR